MLSASLNKIFLPSSSTFDPTIWYSYNRCWYKNYLFIFSSTSLVEGISLAKNNNKKKVQNVAMPLDNGLVDTGFASLFFYTSGFLKAQWVGVRPRQTAQFITGVCAQDRRVLYNSMLWMCMLKPKWIELKKSVVNCDRCWEIYCFTQGPPINLVVFHLAPVWMSLITEMVGFKL